MGGVSGRAVGEDSGACGRHHPPHAPGPRGGCPPRGLSLAASVGAPRLGGPAVAAHVVAGQGKRRRDDTDSRPWLTHCVMYQWSAGPEPIEPRHPALVSGGDGQRHGGAGRRRQAAMPAGAPRRRRGTRSPRPEALLKSDSATVVYATAHRAFHFLLESYGEERIRRLIAGMGDGREFPRGLPAGRRDLRPRLRGRFQAPGTAGRLAGLLAATHPHVSSHDSSHPYPARRAKQIGWRPQAVKWRAACAGRLLLGRTLLVDRAPPARRYRPPRGGSRKIGTQGDALLNSRGEGAVADEARPSSPRPAQRGEGQGEGSRHSSRTTWPAPN